MSNKKNKVTKYLLISDDWCEADCKTKTYDGITINGRNQDLNTVYVKHKMFHRSKLGRDVEHQNKHLVLFNTIHDQMEVLMLST